MAKLTAATRKKIPSSEFVFPDTREYPIEDRNHAIAAESMVERNGTPSQIRKVDREVKEEYPSLGKSKKGAVGVSKESMARHAR